MHQIIICQERSRSGNRFANQNPGSPSSATASRLNVFRSSSRDVHPGWTIHEQWIAFSKCLSSVWIQMAMKKLFYYINRILHAFPSARLHKRARLTFGLECLFRCWPSFTLTLQGDHVRNVFQHEITTPYSPKLRHLFRISASLHHSPRRFAKRKRSRSSSIQLMSRHGKSNGHHHPRGSQPA